MPSLKKLLTLSLTSVLFWTLLPTVSAELQGGFSAVPANPNLINQNRFIFEAKPGETIKDSLYIENQSDKEVSFIFYAGDDKAPDDKFILKTQKEENFEIGKWVSFDQKGLTLKAKENATVDFRLDIPSDTELQDYSGGIAIEKRKQEANFNINSRIAIRIDLKVTDTPNPPQKLIQKKSFTEKIDPTLLSVSLLLFILSGSYLLFSKKN